MKKTIKNLITTLSLILVITFSVFAVACSNSANQVASNTPATNIADQGGTGDAENVNQETPAPEAPKNETFDISTLNGIYKYTSSEYTFDDKHYDNLSELISFFKTRDENGVFYAAKKLGFDEFISNITVDKYYNKPKAILINNGEVLNLCYDESEIYSYIDKTNNYSLTAISNKINASRNDIKFEINEDSISIYYQFTYVNDSNQVVSTPLYIKTTLEKQPHSTNLFTGKVFEYQANSLKLNISPVSTVEKDVYLEMLANVVFDSLKNQITPEHEQQPGFIDMFKPENILSTIEETASSFTYNLLDDLSIKAEVYDTFYTFVNNFGTYENSGVTGRIVSRVITETTDVLNFEIAIASDATLTFSLIAK